MSFNQIRSPIEEIIEEAKQGRMFILVDNEDRENEGDLIIPAEKATAEAINFMARFGRGLICLTLGRERAELLNLPMMVQQNRERLQTAFTVSIEAAEGVTTGISAADRAQTIRVAIDPTAGAADLVSPGHVFPLVARDGGVLTRVGHTEASVDISRLAGLNPSAVICEILNEDGTMARRDDLVAYARRHGLKIGTIADLVVYRRKTETLVRKVFEDRVEVFSGGKFDLRIYAQSYGGPRYLALSKGDLWRDGPVLVATHAFNVLDDLVRGAGGVGAAELRRQIGQIDQEGRGVILLVEEAGAASLVEQLLRRRQRGWVAEPVDFRISAQILHELGVDEVIFLGDDAAAAEELARQGVKVLAHHPSPDRRPVASGGNILPFKLLGRADGASEENSVTQGFAVPE